MKKPFGELEDFTYAKTKKRLPVVLSISEVNRVLTQLKGRPWVIACLLYGSGLRLMEAMRLRVKDIDFVNQALFIRHGKGGKDRTTLLPAKLIDPLRTHLLKQMAQHKHDCLKGAGYVPLPGALYKNTPKLHNPLAGSISSRLLSFAFTLKLINKSAGIVHRKPHKKLSRERW